MIKINPLHLCFLLFLCMLSCDFDGKKECAWVIEPEPDLIGRTEEGLIPVCARNRITQKQDCRLQTTLSFAKKIEGKKFRYSELVTENFALPRTIKKIKFCD